MYVYRKKQKENKRSEEEGGSDVERAVATKKISKNARAMRFRREGSSRDMHAC